MERPIIFSTDMVKAILDGRKTQTRRVVRRPIYIHSDGTKQRVWTEEDEAKEVNALLAGRSRYALQKIKCPYGKIGDRLWVRETWRVYSENNNYATDEKKLWIEYKAGYRSGFRQQRDTFSAEQDDELALKAWGKARKIGTWRPSIHMPRWASRITLEITNIQVQRLQDISEEDAIAEGITYDEAMQYADGGSPDYVLAFAQLWDSINASRGFGWVTNPWVWVIHFKVVQMNLKP